MGGITSDEYEMGIARLVERALALALVAYGHSENDLRFDPGVRMRAALRAAWEAE